MKALDRLGDVALFITIWVICTVLFGIVARVMYDLFMIGFNAW